MQRTYVDDNRCESVRSRGCVPSCFGLARLGSLPGNGALLMAVLCGPAGPGRAFTHDSSRDWALGAGLRQRGVLLLYRVYDRESTVGFDSGLRRFAHRHARRCRALERRQCFAGFAAARALLGLGEGATFPGGLRTAVESLPVDRRARGIATSFSGGTLGAILTPIIAVPIGLKFGWRTAFLLTGALGAIWLVIWFAIARPPYLPKVEHKPQKLGWPNLYELRFWTLVASYALPAISAGPILTIFPLYFSRAMGVSQADLGRILWMPPLAWGLGYFFWGWAADKFATEDPRPVGLMVLLTILALAFGLTTWTSSVMIAMLLTSSSTFVAGGFP